MAIRAPDGANINIITLLHCIIKFIMLHYIIMIRILILKTGNIKEQAELNVKPASSVLGVRFGAVLRGRNHTAQKTRNMFFGDGDHGIPPI